MQPGKTHPLSIIPESAPALIRDRYAVDLPDNDPGSTAAAVVRDDSS